MSTISPWFLALLVFVGLVVAVPTHAQFAPSGVIVSDGTSVTVFRGDVWNWPNCSQPCSNAYGDWVYAAIGSSSLAVYSVGATATTTAQLDATAPARVDAHFDPTARTHVLLFFGGFSNCIFAGGSATGCLADEQAYVAHRKAVGWTVVLLTEIPRYIAGQDADEGAGWFEWGRLWFNTQLLSGCHTTFGADACLDAASLDQFSHANSIDGPAYLSDNTHLSMDGVRVLGKFVARELVSRGLVK